MGLFEKAQAYQKQKRGLYHKLLELRKLAGEEPKGLYAKARRFFEEFRKQNDEIHLPEYTVEDSPRENDPEFAYSESKLSQKQDFDLFEEWEREARAELDKEKKEEEKQQIIEEESDILPLPEEIHIASQKRIDYYLALFDILEELDAVESYEELLETAAYSIQEQLGTRSILVFGNRAIFDTKITEMEFLFQIGYEELSFKIPVDDGFLKECQQYPPEEILYVNSVIKKVEKWGGSILQKYPDLLKNFVLILTVMDQSRNIYAIFLLSLPLEQSDYILDDLEFLRVLKKQLLSRIQKLEKNYRLQKEIQETKEFADFAKKAFHFSAEISRKKELDEVSDKLGSFLQEVFGITMYSFAMINPEENLYRIAGGSNISIHSIQKFQIPLHGELINLISNVNSILELENFRHHQDIVDNYAEEDIALMERCILAPLVHKDWLIGFLIIHKMEKDFPELHREWLQYLMNLLAPVFAGFLVSGEKQVPFKDTFSPLKKRLEEEVRRSQEMQYPFSIVDLRIKNLKRLLAVNPVRNLDGYLNELLTFIHSRLGKQDYLARMSQGRMLIILINRNKEEAQAFMKKLLQNIKEKHLFPDSPLEPSLGYDIYTFPHDVDTLKKLLALLDF